MWPFSDKRLSPHDTLTSGHMWPLPDKCLSATDYLIRGHMWPFKLFRRHSQFGIQRNFRTVLFPDVLCGHARRINQGVLLNLYVF